MSTQAPFSVGISTYNAFNHLRVSLDIIRHNWRQWSDAPVVVSCNNPDVDREINNLPINLLVRADHTIPWTHDGGKTTDKAGFRARALDCIQHAGEAALGFGRPYTILTHADGWILSDAKVEAIVGYMKAHKKVVGAGGWGLEYRVQRFNIDQQGELDDYFFVIDNDFARSKGFWKFKAKAGDPIVGHAWYLVTRFLQLASPDQLYHYQNYKSGGVEYAGDTPRHVHPWRYDDTFKMLHIDDFVTYRDKVADIFARCGISQGEYIRQLLAGTLAWQANPPTSMRIGFKEKVRGVMRGALQRLVGREDV